MLTHSELEALVTALPDVVLDYPFGEGNGVYRIGDAKGKMFAIIDETAAPLRISLKCDPQLAELMREKYETILPGYHLNKKHWNTIICTGQVPEDEFKDLIRHSYELVKG